VKKVWLLLLIVMLAIFVPLDLLLESGYGHTVFPWSGIAGFFSLFGFGIYSGVRCGFTAVAA